MGRNIRYIIGALLLSTLLSWQAHAAEMLEITSPVPGSVIETSTVTFEWEGLSQVVIDELGGDIIYQFSLYADGEEISTQQTGDQTSAIVTGIPSNAHIESQVYLVSPESLWGRLAVYSTDLIVELPLQASLTSPTPETILQPGSATFTWSESQATQYYLYVGGAQGTSNYFSQSVGLNRTATVNTIPSSGKIWVRVWSLTSSGWKYNDYEFDSINPNGVPAPRELTSPVPNSEITTSNVTFTFTDGQQVTNSYLYVGTSVGQNNIKSAPIPATQSQMTIYNISLNGLPIYVRLWSYIINKWEYSDYQFTRKDEALIPKKSDMISPSVGTTLTGDSVEFNWTQGQGIDYHYLFFGSRRGGREYARQPLAGGTTFSYEFEKLQYTNGVLWVRLYSHLPEGWKYTDYQYSVEVTNQEPVFENFQETIEIEEGENYNADFTITDPDGDTVYLTERIEEYLPDWADVSVHELSNGSLDIGIEFEPGYQDSGTYEIEFYVSDGKKQIRRDMEIIVNDTNEPPVIQSSSSTNVFQGTQAMVDITMTDADGDTLVLTRPTAAEMPVGMECIETLSEDGILKARLVYEPEDDMTSPVVVPVEVSDGAMTSLKNITFGVMAAKADVAPMLYVANIDYNAAGQMLRIEYANGSTTTHEYDDLTLRLQRTLTVAQDLTTVQDLNYAYDPVGNIVSITDNKHTATQTFEYDAQARLVQATGQTYGTKTYEYNEIGNIIEKDGLTYMYGEGSAGPHAVTSLSDGSSFTYDANGNMDSETSSGGALTEYIYDVENRLTTVRKDSVVTSVYTYDGDGGRTSKTVSGVQTKFIGSMYEESGAAQTEHIFVGSMRIASITDGVISFHHADHLGGLNVITDEAGVIKEVVEYKPFGEFARREKFGGGEEVAWHYFTGQHYDPETELYFYNARYYNPKLGRFISADTIVQDPSNPQTLNRYSYTGNNPINNIDPSGNSFWKSFAAAFVAVVATVFLGPAGYGLSLGMAGAIGGAIGGAAGALINGAGIKGALIGAATGGILGAAGGTFLSWNNTMGHSLLGGMFLAGAANAKANDTWDDFVGGILGGYTGSSFANGLLSYWNDPLSTAIPENGSGVGENDNWASLGIGTTEAKAQQHANSTGEVTHYTKSRGMGADLFRAGIKKFFPKSARAAKDMARLMARHGDGANIYAHSEGALTLAGAIKQLNVDQVKFKNMFIDFNGAPITRSAARNLSRSIGAKFKFGSNIADPVRMFGTYNPVKAGVYGTLGISTGAYFHGTEQYQ